MNSFGAVAYRAQRRLRFWLRRFALIWLLASIAMYAFAPGRSADPGAAAFFSVLLAAPCALVLNCVLSVALFTLGG